MDNQKKKKSKLKTRIYIYTALLIILALWFIWFWVSHAGQVILLVMQTGMISLIIGTVIALAAGFNFASTIYRARKALQEPQIAETEKNEKRDKHWFYFKIMLFVCGLAWVVNCIMQSVNLAADSGLLRSSSFDYVIKKLTTDVVPQTKSGEALPIADLTALDAYGQVSLTDFSLTSFPSGNNSHGLFRSEIVFREDGRIEMEDETDLYVHLYVAYFEMNSEKSAQKLAEAFEKDDQKINYIPGEDMEQTRAALDLDYLSFYSFNRYEYIPTLPTVVMRDENKVAKIALLQVNYNENEDVKMIPDREWIEIMAQSMKEINQ